MVSLGSSFYGLLDETSSAVIVHSPCGNNYMNLSIVVHCTINFKLLGVYFFDLYMLEGHFISGSHR